MTNRVPSGLLRGMLAIIGLLCVFAPVRAEELALVVQITIDQLRGDMPQRFSDRFTDADSGGFSHFLRRGVVYTNAHYGHASTYTASGHATLFTGADPARHGIPGNYWLNRVTGAQVYCVSDERFPVLDGGSHGAGASPQYLISSTIGDELTIGSGGEARVFAVSLKDRGAIIPAGRTGKAFWYSNRNGGFTTSTYYFEALPAWVQAWNERKLADEYHDRQWELLYERSSYRFADADDRPWERSYGGLGRTFPHRTTRGDLPAHYRELRYTPFGDELTLAFAKELVTKTRLGLTGATDFLSISFSATDYVGHAFGPNSLEAEDNLLRLDRTLSELFSFLDRHVGLDKVLLVLSSDHGVDEAPEYKNTLGFEVGRIDPAAVKREVEKGLQRRLASKQTFIADISIPGVYLHPSAATGVELSATELEDVVVQELLQIPGIALAVTRSSMMTNELPRTPLHTMLQRSFHPERSGDVVIVQEQSWYLSPEVEQNAAMHGSPYAYDTFVPIMFVRSGVPPQRIVRRVGPESVAPTLAGILGVKAPTGSTGEILEELFVR